MSKSRYVALLRGINVGGNNIMKMVDLRACFEGLGFTDVQTLIQSGNVVFSAARRSKPSIIRVVEEGLSAAFGYSARVAIVSAAELASVVEQAPAGFGQQPDHYRYDVLFVMTPLTLAQALEQVSINPAVDAVHAGEHALYFRRLISQATRSRLSKITQLPAYKNLTIRNWNTTTKLLQMASAAHVER